MRTGTRGRGKLLFGLGLGVVALTAAACGSSHSSSSNTTPTTAATTASGTQVTVGETEFKLAVSMNSFNPGAYTFRAVNNGKIVHSLEITGPGVSATTPDLQPGPERRSQGHPAERQLRPLLPHRQSQIAGHESGDHGRRVGRHDRRAGYRSTGLYPGQHRARQRRVRWC